MADVDILITHDSLDFMVNAQNGVPSIVKGQPFSVEVIGWANNSKINKIELQDFKPVEYDPIASTWVLNPNTAPDWQGVSITFTKTSPVIWTLTPSYPGGGAHNIMKFTVKLTFKNNMTFTVDPILDERPT